MENFIVAHRVGSEVLYSTTCSEQQTYTGDSLSVIEISTVKHHEEPMPIAPGKANETVERIDAAIDVLKGSLKVGIFFFPPLSPVLLAFSGLGSLLQSGLKFLTGEPDPVEERMKELSKQMKQLEENTMILFSDMKSFLTENNFSIEVVTDALTQIRFMNDCWSNPSEESIELFKEDYERNRPLSMTYKLMSLLDQKSTNPIMMAMSVERANLKAPFEKWEKIIKAALGQFIAVEAFACGLLKDGNSYDFDRIMERSQEVFQAIESWKDTYKRDEYYWEVVQKEIVVYATEKMDLTNAEKADQLQKMMDSFLTHHSFYIIVFNRTINNDNSYSFHCPKQEDHLMFCVMIGSCNIIIYRSRSGNFRSKEEYNQICESVRSCYEGKLDLLTTIHGAIERQLVATKILPDDAFIFLISKTKDVEIRGANCAQSKWGPGWWLESVLVKWHGGEDLNYKLLAAFD